MVRKVVLALGVAALAVGIGNALAQSTSTQQSPPPAAQATPPAAEPATPATPESKKFPEGPPAELKKLSLLEGNWQEKTHVHAGMLGPETDYTGKSHFKWDFNGMHLSGNHDYQMRGKPMTGHSVWGWDYEQKKYQLIWMNGMTPTTSVYYGTFAGDSTLVLYSTFMAGGRAVTERVTYVFSGGNSYTFTLESDMPGTMGKVMETVATKSKAPTASKKAAPAKKAGTTKSGTAKKSG